MNGVLFIYHTLLLNFLLHLFICVCRDGWWDTHTCHGFGEVVRRQFGGVGLNSGYEALWQDLLSHHAGPHMVNDTGNTAVNKM